MDWKEISGNWVLIPRHPSALCISLGSLLSQQHLAHRWLLEQLAAQGYAVVATPFVNTLEHAVIAQSVLQSFESAILNYTQQVFSASAICQFTDWDTAWAANSTYSSAASSRNERAGNI